MTSEQKSSAQASSRTFIVAAIVVMAVCVAAGLYMTQRSGSQRASAELAYLSHEAATSAAFSENRAEGEWLGSCLKSTMSGRRSCDPAQLSDRLAFWQARLPNLPASALPADFCGRVANAAAQASAEVREKHAVLQSICVR
ncbi:hypothetical protein [Azospirillum sp. SYSU D00513]|uniref:hypothetical protein n=1 Tax=Azospirillum sp. SYSU D00513 TaxID=2812561 RepID=UPI001A97312A|nr:hypothetical protein [Azospirillum sp. SYSU D00513]